MKVNMHDFNFNNKLTKQAGDEAVFRMAFPVMMVGLFAVISVLFESAFEENYLKIALCAFILLVLIIPYFTIIIVEFIRR